MSFALQRLRAVALLIVASNSWLISQSRPRDRVSDVGAHSLTLDSVLARVAIFHPLSAAAADRVDGARGSRMTARSFGNPMLSWQEENGAFPGQSLPLGMMREISTFAMIPLSPLYRRSARTRQADRLVDAANGEFAATRQRVALDAARAFYRLALAQTSLRTSSDSRDWLDSLVRYTEVRVREGAVAEVDLMRMQVERDRTAGAIALTEIEAARASAALTAYVAVDSIVATVADTIVQGTPLAPLQQVIAAARRLRPDLVAARARSKAAQAARALEQASIVRDASGMIGSKSTGGAHSLIAGVTIPIPLFDQNRGEIRRADAESRAVAQELTWMESQAIADVSAAWEAARILSAQIVRLQQGFLRRADDARRITLAAYREGAVPLVQVLDASRALAEVRDLYYRTLFAQQLSVLELNAAIGATQLTTMPALSGTPADSTINVTPDPTRPPMRGTTQPNREELR